ncbi:hypothetical protein AX16_000108 [Volvariella volvacea WC 439]|nr:hypothetical protein AX16_000108 [Volvariella volvacea WC 439]
MSNPPTNTSTATPNPFGGVSSGGTNPSGTTSQPNFFAAFGGGKTSFTGGTNSTTPAPGANPFGTNPAPASSSTPTSIFNTKSDATTGTSAPSFSSPFSLPKPGEQPKPITSNFFATPPAGTSSSPSGTGMFGLPPKPSTDSSATPASTNPTSTSSATPLSLFSTLAKPAGSASTGTSSTPTPAAAAPTVSPASFGFGTKAPEKKDGPAPAAPSTLSPFSLKPAEEKKDGASALSSFGFPKPAEASKAGGSSIFNLPKPGEKEGDKAGAAPSVFTLPKPGEKEGEKVAPSIFTLQKPGEKEGDKAASSSSPFSLLKPTDKPDKPDAPKLGASLSPFPLPKPGEKEGDKVIASTNGGSTISVPAPSTLQGKTIEEIVNRWTSELETHVREFSKFAGEVAVWDRALMENGNNLAAIYSHVTAAEREQNDIDQSLDHIERQQKELSSTLDAYEKATQEILGAQGGSLRSMDTGPADTERDKNYMLATDLHTHLDDLSDSLSQMIESVNSLSLQPTSNESSDDPLTQIAQILNSHLESLQWIDGAVREVESKVTDVERRIKDSGHATSLGGASGKTRAFGLNR